MKLICDCHPRTEEAPRAPNSSPAAACPLVTLGPPVGGQSDAAAPPTSASLNNRRPHDEYGESEYGGLPVEYAAFVTMLRPENSSVRCQYGWQVAASLCSYGIAAYFSTE